MYIYVNSKFPYIKTSGFSFLSQYKRKADMICRLGNDRSGRPDKGFTLIELLVVISIIAVLMSILMPSLGKARKLAKSVVCCSNLRQWGIVSTMYTSDNKNYFTKGWYVDNVKQRQLWMALFRDYYGNVAEFRCCPTANKPEKNEGIFATWGPFEDSTDQNLQYYFSPEDYGSYGMNEWLYNNDGTTNQGASYSPTYFWRKTGYSNADRIPVFFDSVHYEALPMATDKPYPEPDGYYAAASGKNEGEMSRVAINRHDGYTNINFMDCSVRKVGLKETWSLKWHKGYKLYREPVWPDWMRSFK